MKVAIITTALIFLVGMSLVGTGRVYGEWETSLSLTPLGGGFSLAGSASTIKGMYFTGEVADLSIARLSKLAITDYGLSGTGFGVQAYFTLPALGHGGFDLATYLEEDIVIDWPIGTYTVLSDALFSLASRTLKRGWLELGVSAYGLRGTGSFLLIPVGKGYAFGSTVSLQGTTLAGLSLKAVSHFGVWEIGEKFTEVSPPLGGGACSGYNGTEVSLNGMMFGCASYDGSIRFTDSGFSYARFDVEVKPPKDWWLPVTLDIALQFQPQTKSLIMTVPTLYYLNGYDGSLTLYIELEAASRLGSGLSFSGLRSVGLRMNGIPLGGATIAGIISFGDPLYAGVKEDPIHLHADGYTFSTGGVQPGKPTPYGAVISLTRVIGNLAVAIDIYFEEGGTLFGLALLTGEVNYTLSSGFELSLGVAFDPPNGLRELRAEFTRSFYR